MPPPELPEPALTEIELYLQEHRRKMKLGPKLSEAEPLRAIGIGNKNK